MLAALKVFGAGRGNAYAELPRWRRNARRPSCLDLVTLLRKQASQHPDITVDLDIQHSPVQLVAAARLRNVETPACSTRILTMRPSAGPLSGWVPVTE